LDFCVVALSGHGSSFEESCCVIGEMAMRLLEVSF
jgi:hypothetical protein